MRDRLRKYVETIITDDALRIRIQMIIMTMLLAAVSFTMFIVNIIAQARALMVITGTFSLLAVIATLLVVIYRRTNIAAYLICVSVLLMFTYFLLTGGIDGFSPIWLCLLPSTGMFFLGIKRGTLISLLMLVIIIGLLWTPYVDSLPYHYTRTFAIRFPIVYISCMIIAFSLEYVRLITYTKMREAMDQLDQLGKTDDLTQINNRRYFDTKLDELWELMIRAKGPLSLLIIDVDYFKLFNDHYGHLAGDNILVEVAKIISGTVSRNNDIIARWGGEEFVVLLPLTAKPGALALAEEITAAVRSKAIPHALSDLPHKYVTVSIGVASLYPDPASSPVRLLELADNSLYEAKKSGRNRIGSVY